ncbi:MAG TPA: hypothetical protein VHS78_08110 [Candidatus Elarobacter sp.]|jgi:hypothetical protein|nr:hypothetical protein [Candidatus Elarobacter sp.]
MPSSAEGPRAEIAHTIVALERACLDADAALVERRWTDVDAAVGAQAELTAELARLFDASPRHAPANDAKVAQRLRGVLAYRDDQLRRLDAYREEISTRLASIGKVNAFSRSLGKHTATPRLYDGQY